MKWRLKDLREYQTEESQMIDRDIEDAGAQCKKLGYCPEARGCGRYPKKMVNP